MSCESKREVKDDSKDLVLTNEIVYESVVQGKGPRLRYKFRSGEGRDVTSCYEMRGDHQVSVERYPSTEPGHTLKFRSQED